MPKRKRKVRVKTNPMSDDFYREALFHGFAKILSMSELQRKRKRKLRKRKALRHPRPTDIGD